MDHENAAIAAEQEQANRGAVAKAARERYEREWPRLSEQARAWNAAHAEALGFRVCEAFPFTARCDATDERAVSHIRGLTRTARAHAKAGGMLVHYGQDVAFVFVGMSAEIEYDERVRAADMMLASAEYVAFCVAKGVEP